MGLLDMFGPPQGGGGLLDPSTYDPRMDIALSVAGQLLDNAGPSATRRGMFQGVPQALMQGRQGAFQRQVQQQQYADMLTASAERKRQAEARTKLGAYATPTYTREDASQPWQQQESSVDQDGLLAAWMDADPAGASKMFGNIFAPEAYTLGENDVRYQGNRVIGRGPAKPPPAPTWHQPVDGVDANGNPALLMTNSAGDVKPVAGYSPKPPNPKEPPEVVQLVSALNNARSPEERQAIQGRIDALTKNNLSPIEQKELFDATDRYQAGDFAMNALRDALTYNDKAYEGFAADAALVTNRNIGRDQEGVNATTLFRSIMTGQALEALRATFGANPTEGERKILLEIQSSVNMSRGERKALIDRAISLAEQRKKAEANRVQMIQSGGYRSGNVAMPPPAATTTGPSGNGGWSITPVGP